MHYRTQGIVLSNSKYNDRYSITHIFVREFGKTAYILPRSKSKKSKINNALFVPFSVLNLHVEHLPLRDIQRIKDAERAFPTYSLQTDVSKISIVFFLSEFLSKALVETHDNELIFDYIKNSIRVLEHSTRSSANFHLAFMFHLTRFLGITPKLENDKKTFYFDLRHSEFVPTQPMHTDFLKKEQVDFLEKFKRINYRNMHRFRLSRYDRNAIVDYMLRYYRLHIYEFPPIKSLDILHDIF